MSDAVSTVFPIDSSFGTRESSEVRQLLGGVITVGVSNAAQVPPSALKGYGGDAKQEASASGFRNGHACSSRRTLR